MADTDQSRDDQAAQRRAGRVHVFRVFARHLNFALAANELGISQSALRKEIQWLQDEFGCSLYALPREAREYRLTPAGGQLAQWDPDTDWSDIRLGAVYDAFVVYSRSRDVDLSRLVAKQLSSGGQLSVCRDEDIVRMDEPGSVWSSIKMALNSSKWLVVLVSGPALGSAWVYREVSYWVSMRPNYSERIVFIPTEAGLDGLPEYPLWRERIPEIISVMESTPRREADEKQKAKDSHAPPIVVESVAALAERMLGSGS